MYEYVEKKLRITALVSFVLWAISIFALGSWLYSLDNDYNIPSPLWRSGIWILIAISLLSVVLSLCIYHFANHAEQKDVGAKLKTTALVSVLLWAAAIVVLGIWLHSFHKDYYFPSSLLDTGYWLLTSLVVLAIVFAFWIYILGTQAESYTHTNQDTVFTVRRTAPRKTLAVKKHADGSWVCPACGLHNPTGRLWCEKCDIEATFE